MIDGNNQKNIKDFICKLYNLKLFLTLTIILFLLDIYLNKLDC